MVTAGEAFVGVVGVDLRVATPPVSGHRDGELAGERPWLVV